MNLKKAKQQVRQLEEVQKDLKEVLGEIAEDILQEQYELPIARHLGKLLECMIMCSGYIDDAVKVSQERLDDITNPEEDVSSLSIKDIDLMVNDLDND